MGAGGKGRYVLTEVQKLVESGAEDPFRELGRRAGSNAAGIRNSYLAIRILLHARDEFGVDVDHLQDHRFGIWLRCMNSADVRAYIGLCGEVPGDRGSTIQGDKLEEVLGDLKSQGGEPLRCWGTRAT